MESSPGSKAAGTCWVYGSDRWRSGFRRQLSPAEHLAPLVRELAQTTGETAYATGWWSNEIAVLTIARGTNPVRAAEVPQGHVANANARASARVSLSYSSPSTRREYLESHELSAMTPKTKTDPAELEADFLEIREKGYAEDYEEFAAGVCCLAVPIDPPATPFTLAISAPLQRFTEQRDRYLDELQKVAAEASVGQS